MKVEMKVDYYPGDTGEFIKVIDIVLYIFKTLDFNDFVTQVSLRDPEDKEKCQDCH